MALQKRCEGTALTAVPFVSTYPADVCVTPTKDGTELGSLAIQIKHY
jgi:hypothetical protein